MTTILSAERRSDSNKHPGLTSQSQNTETPKKRTLRFQTKPRIKSYYIIDGENCNQEQVTDVLVTYFCTTGSTPSDVLVTYFSTTGGTLSFLPQQVHWVAPHSNQPSAPH